MIQDTKKYIDVHASALVFSSVKAVKGAMCGYKTRDDLLVLFAARRIAVKHGEITKVNVLERKIRRLHKQLKVIA